MGEPSAADAVDGAGGAAGRDVRDDATGREEIAAIGGRALRETTRLGASPYSMWRDIALTNTEPIADTLHALEQRLAHLRENLRTPELREEFRLANEFRSTAVTEAAKRDLPSEVRWACKTIIQPEHSRLTMCLRRASGCAARSTTRRARTRRCCRR